MHAAVTAASAMMVIAAEKNSVTITRRKIEPKLPAAAIDSLDTVETQKRTRSTTRCARSLSAAPDHRLPAHEGNRGLICVSVQTK